MGESRRREEAITRNAPLGTVALKKPGRVALSEYVGMFGDPGPSAGTPGKIKHFVSQDRDGNLVEGVMFVDEWRRMRNEQRAAQRKDAVEAVRNVMRTFARKVP